MSNIFNKYETDFSYNSSYESSEIDLEDSIKFRQKHGNFYINSDSSEESSDSFSNNLERLMKSNNCLSSEDIERYYSNKHKFGQSFIITMKNRSERYENCNNLLKKLKLNPIKFNAIDGKSVSDQYFLDKYNHLSRGEIGCLLSHLSILSLTAKNENRDNYTLIFEDDITTNIQSDETLHKLFKNLSKLDEEVDIIYFGKCLETCTKMEHLEDNIYKAYGPLCTHSYAIKNSCAHKLINHLNEPKNIDIYLYQAIDILYQELIIKNIWKSLVLHPSIFYQDVYRLKSDLRDIMDQQRNMVECIDVITSTCSDKKYEYGLAITFIILGFLIIISALSIYTINK